MNCTKRIISIHEYVLKANVTDEQFEQALQSAATRGLFNLPGLVDHHFLKGIKGARQGCYTAIWIYESQVAWEALWGPLDQPRTKHAYPKSWQIWEEEVLAPLLTQHPDTITFTSYIDLNSEWPDG
ncbi:MAG: hypothetical protein R2911_23665 [Caldilineaceae bacterium]